MDSEFSADSGFNFNYMSDILNDGDEINKESDSGPKDNANKPSEDPASMGLYDWVQCIVTALLCGIFAFMFIGRVIGVVGSSMFPTLHNGDKVITTNLFYEPAYGDIVVVQTDTFGDEPIVKRVIATEGQTVNIDFDAGIVYVDGVALQEDYINELTTDPEDFTDEVTVPEGCLFLMGDNRNASTDSRSDRVGFVDERCVIGKVLIVAVPGVEGDDGRDWSRIGSVYK